MTEKNTRFSVTKHKGEPHEVAGTEPAGAGGVIRRGARMRRLTIALAFLVALVGVVTSAKAEETTLDFYWNRCTCGGIGFCSDDASMHPGCGPIDDIWLDVDELPVTAELQWIRLDVQGCARGCWYDEATHVDRNPGVRALIDGWTSDIWGCCKGGGIAQCGDTCANLHTSYFFGMHRDDIMDIHPRRISFVSYPVGIPLALHSARFTFIYELPNPTVAEVSVSDMEITDADEGRTFTVTVSFSLPMRTDGESDPSLVFSPDVAGTLLLLSGDWLDDSTYAATYLVVDDGVEQSSVTVDVWGARSIDDVRQSDYVPVHEFAIDTGNPPTPVGLSPSDGCYTQDTTPTLSWNESIDPSDGIVLYYVHTRYVGILTTEGRVLAGADYTCTAHAPSYTLEWSVRACDAHLNPSNSSPTFTLYVDSVPPEIHGCPVDIEVRTAPGTLDARVRWTEPTVADDLSGIQSLTCSHLSGDRYPVGKTTVTYTATDMAGNAASQSFDVTVIAVAEDVVTDVITPAGAMGFLDRGWHEAEEPPVVGEMEVSAIYEVGELVTGCCTAAEDLPHVILTWYAVTIGEEYDVREPIDSEIVSSDDGAFRFEVDTASWSPGYYDIRLGIPGEGCVWIRVEVVPPAE